MEEQELQEYQAVFQKFDRDGSGAQELLLELFEDVKATKTIGLTWFYCTFYRALKQPKA